MIGKFIHDVIGWVVLSSKNPEQTSLTLKSSLVAVATFLTMVFGLAHVAVPISSLTPIVDLIISWIQTALLLVSIGGSIYGAIRKLYLTVTGKNVVLQ